MPSASFVAPTAGNSATTVWIATDASAAASGVPIRIMPFSCIVLARRPLQDFAAPRMRSKHCATASCAALSPAVLMRFSMPIRLANITVVLRFASIPSLEASGEGRRPQQGGGLLVRLFRDRGRPLAGGLGARAVARGVPGRDDDDQDDCHQADGSRQFHFFSLV